MRRLLFALFALSVAVTGCGGGSEPEQARPPEYVDEPDRIPATALNPGDYEAISKRRWTSGGSHIIRSRDEWQALWAKSANRDICVAPDPCEDPTTPMPELDFAQYSLIAIFGELSPGESVFTHSVTAKSEGLQVLTLRRKPMFADQSRAQVQTPFAIVFLIPATTSPVRFLEEEDSVNVPF